MKALLVRAYRHASAFARRWSEGYDGEATPIQPTRHASPRLSPLVGATLGLDRAGLWNAVEAEEGLCDPEQAAIAQTPADANAFRVARRPRVLDRG